MSMPTPNWSRLHAVVDRAQAVYAEGKMDRQVWRSLAAEAYEASNGRPDLVQFMIPFAETAWIQEVQSEGLDKVAESVRAA